MGDLISRQAAIDAIKKYDFKSPEYAGYYLMRLKNAIKADLVDDINDIPSAERWVPCSERLPEATRKSYWVCTDNGGQHECRWTNNRFGLGESDEWGWSIFDTPQYSKVVAWMPLPEPYEVEEGEDK